mgnify:CR=1 FL=1
MTILGLPRDHAVRQGSHPHVLSYNPLTRPTPELMSEGFRTSLVVPEQGECDSPDDRGTLTANPPQPRTKTQRLSGNLEVQLEN